MSQDLNELSIDMRVPHCILRTVAHCGDTVDKQVWQPVLLAPVLLHLCVADVALQGIAVGVLVEGDHGQLRGYLVLAQEEAAQVLRVPLRGADEQHGGGRVENLLEVALGGERGVRDGAVVVGGSASGAGTRVRGRELAADGGDLFLDAERVARALVAHRRGRGRVARGIARDVHDWDIWGQMDTARGVKAETLCFCFCAGRVVLGVVPPCDKHEEHEAQDNQCCRGEAGVSLCGFDVFVQGHGTMCASEASTSVWRYGWVVLLCVVVYCVLPLPTRPLIYSDADPSSAGGDRCKNRDDQRSIRPALGGVSLPHRVPLRRSTRSRNDTGTGVWRTALFSKTTAGSGCAVFYLRRRDSHKKRRG